MAFFKPGIEEGREEAIIFVDFNENSRLNIQNSGH